MTDAKKATKPVRGALAPKPVPRQPPQPRPDLDDDVPFDGNPDAAWKTLSLVVDWIKQAETKAAGSLAAAGVIAGVLYNLLKDENDPNCYLLAPAIVTVVMVVATAVSAGMVFRPRLRHRDEPKSPLFFHHIARKHDAPASYIQELALLTADPETLIREIAEQVYWNSKVAHRKYEWASRAVTALILGLLGLGWLTWIFAYRSVSK